MPAKRKLKEAIFGKQRHLTLMTPHEGVNDHFQHHLGMLTHVSVMHRVREWREVSERMEELSNDIFVILPDDKTEAPAISHLIDAIILHCLDPAIIVVTDLPIRSGHVRAVIVPKSMPFNELDGVIGKLLDAIAPT